MPRRSRVRSKTRGGIYEEIPPRVIRPMKWGVTRFENRDVISGGLLAMPNFAAHLSLLPTDFPPTFASLLDAHLPTHSCGSLNGTQCDSKRGIGHVNAKPWKNQEPIALHLGFNPRSAGRPGLFLTASGRLIQTPAQVGFQKRVQFAIQQCERMSGFQAAAGVLHIAFGVNHVVPDRFAAEADA